MHFCGTACTTLPCHACSGSCRSCAPASCGSVPAWVASVYDNKVERHQQSTAADRGTIHRSLESSAAQKADQSMILFSCECCTMAVQNADSHSQKCHQKCLLKSITKRSILRSGRLAGVDRLTVQSHVQGINLPCLRPWLLCPCWCVALTFPWRTMLPQSA